MDPVVTLNRRWILILSLVVTWVAASATPLAARAPALPAELAKVRAVLEKYQDPINAVRDGYLSTVGCTELTRGAPDRVDYGVPGGMVVHFLNPHLISPTPDPFHPPVLLYEPVGDSLRLVAAEWFVPLTTGVKDRPRLFGHPFDGPLEGHYPLMPMEVQHYDLHVWLFKPNPAGLFNPTNPAVKCPKTGYSFIDQPPRRVPQPKP